jgi:hypothetical protein
MYEQLVQSIQCQETAFCYFVWFSGKAGRMQAQRLDLLTPTHNVTICKGAMRLIVTLMTHC